jgi:hypothetical protein
LQKKHTNCEKEKAGDRQKGTSQESIQFTQQLLQCTTVEQDNRAGVGLIWMANNKLRSSGKDRMANLIQLLVLK